MPPDPVLAFFGFSVKDGPPDPQGAVVGRSSSHPGSLAEKAGLKPGNPDRRDRPADGSSPRRSSTACHGSGSPAVDPAPIPLGVLRDGKFEIINLAPPRPANQFS